MKRTYTITIVLSDADLYYLRKLYGKRKSTKPQTLVNIAARRAVAESAKQELNKTGYAPVEEKVHE
jgi:ribosomal protein S19E (S16A)